MTTTYHPSDPISDKEDSFLLLTSTNKAIEVSPPHGRSLKWLVGSGTLMLLAIVCWIKDGSSSSSTQLAQMTPSFWVRSPSTSSSSLASSPCAGLDFSSKPFADMHDGDEKLVSIQGSHLIIQPTADDASSWLVQAIFDPTTCSAQVDFNVPGKASPPPVPLLLTLWKMTTRHQEPKLTLEFTDPSKTLVPSSDTPLNHWVEL